MTRLLSMKHSVLRIVLEGGFGRLAICFMQVRFHGKCKQSILAQTTFCGIRISPQFSWLPQVFTAFHLDSIHESYQP